MGSYHTTIIVHIYKKIAIRRCSRHIAILSPSAAVLYTIQDIDDNILLQKN